MEIALALAVAVADTPLARQTNGVTERHQKENPMRETRNDTASTRWVTVGKGATVETLLAAVWSPYLDATPRQRMGAIDKLNSMDETAQTNLKLVGPLSAADLENISHCEN